MMRFSTKGFFATLAQAVACALMLLAAGAQAQSATEEIDAAGIQRFKQGLQLAEQKRNEDALRVFEQLTRDYPGWPDPYNNLAVLYAARGEEKKAEAALLSALRTHPSYSLVYRNLNSLYAGIAERAYRKALDSKATNARTPTLALATGLEAPVVPDASVASGSVTVIASAAPTNAPSEPVPVTELASNASSEQVADALAEPLAETLTQTRQPLPAESSNVTADRERDVLNAVASWVAAWSAQDVDRYLGHYGHHFQPNNGQSRERWEAVRRIRVSKPEFIDVRIANPVVSLEDEDRAAVRFLQRYRSNTFEGRTLKTLYMSRGPSGWKIIREQAGG